MQTPRNPNPSHTLILNQYMQPHRIAPWQDAVTEYFTGKVEIIAEYDEIIYESKERGITMLMPAVARLIKSVGMYKKGIKFSRINVMVRDRFECSFCGRPFKMDELTYDHVVPRKQGGKTEWTNIVSACRTCNHKKGARTPEQAKMKLLKKPYKPKTLPISDPILAMRREIPSEWVPFVPTGT
jgi:5-methylcytosine-specific restriction endonuclease McrA